MYYHLKLSGAYHETEAQAGGILSLAGGGPRFRFDRFYLRIEKLIQKKRVRTILVDMRQDFDCGNLSGLVSVRDQLLRLKEAGKELVFFAHSYDMAALYLASACGRRIMHPLGSMSFLGAGRTFRFFRNFMDEQGIEAKVLRVGRYKAAGDAFRVSSLDEFNREQHQAILDDTVEEYLQQTAAGYGREEAQLRRLMEGGLFEARSALEKGWIHELAGLEDIKAQWKEQKVRAWKLRRLPLRSGRGARVVVLVFEGGIKDGDNSRGLLTGEMIGADSYIPVIRKLASDRSVKGVVFRINSGGGSALASEDIVRELGRLRKKKPLAVSMSQVAGSGGYWIATEADRIFAERTSITGSIGVIGIYFNLREAFARRGITHDSVKTGEFGDFGNLFRPLAAREEEIITAHIRSLYESFLGKVAAVRNMSTAQVDALGEGHIYSGKAALKAGLVDELGGLHAALAWMAARLKVKNISIEFQPRRRKSLLSRMLGGSGGESKPYAAVQRELYLRGMTLLPVQLQSELAELQGSLQAVTPGYSPISDLTCM